MATNEQVPLMPSDIGEANPIYDVVAINNADKAADKPVASIIKVTKTNGSEDAVPKKNVQFSADVGPVSQSNASPPSTSDTISGDVPLTIQEKSKVDTELKAQVEAQRGPSPIIIAIKWCVIIIVGLVFLGCLTFSKLSIVNLGNYLGEIRKNGTHDTNPGAGNRTAGSSVQVQYGSESIFLMMVFAMLIPYVATLLRSMWCGGLRKDRPMPCLKSVLMIIVAALAESAGISMFTLEVLSETPNYICILLMNGVFVIPIIFQMIGLCRSWRNRHQRADDEDDIPSMEESGPNRACSTIVLILAFIFSLVGISLTAWSIYDKGKSNPLHTEDNKWQIPLSLLLISFAWCPDIQKLQIYPQKKDLLKLIRKKKIVKYSQIAAAAKRDRDNDEPLYGNASGDTDSSAGTESIEGWISEEEQALSEDPSSLIFKNPQYSARWKSAVISSAIKIIFVAGFSILYGYVFDMIKMESLHAGILNITVDHPRIISFFINLGCSFVGYIFAWVACVMCIHTEAFVIPLVLSTPVALTIMLLVDSCQFGEVAIATCSKLSQHYLEITLPGAACLYVSQLLSTGLFIYKTALIIKQKESQLFWLPGFSSVMLEQSLLLSRKNMHTDQTQAGLRAKIQRSKIIICTTMYREAAHEMEQLLESIERLNSVIQVNERHFQSHVFFDNGVRGSRLTEFALQLVSIARNTFGITCDTCTRVATPYGCRLTWLLPSRRSNRQGMIFTIHLKDNQKVKNKKRWSQIMYMSWVLDYFIREDETAEDEDCFILSTDADVEFGPESVEALLDLMTRDSRVGAVCARTHPMGNGPLCWYQIFDYAIGHWLQKAANDVMGSVLCCPGCFSVYRVSALREVVSTYATDVKEASDFLIKDMGEDRWLCTLLLEAGWRLEYCAASECRTFCPEDFDEYFKQRRRWVPSSMANVVLMLQRWNVITLFNQHVGWVFMLYQMSLLCASIVNPAVSILVMVGGLYYAWEVNQVASLVLLVLTSIIFAWICLTCSSETQLKAAKVLTVILSLLMSVVVIGTALQIMQESKAHSHNSGKNVTVGPNSAILRHLLVLTTVAPEEDITLPFTVITLFLAIMIGIFVVTAILHLSEALCLLHGIWYLLCLPAGNLILMIYSICNMTDRSWGTREEKKVSHFDSSGDWKKDFLNICTKIWFCFKKKEERRVETTTRSVQTGAVTDSPTNESPSDDESEQDVGAVRAAGRPASSRSLDRRPSFEFHGDQAERRPVAVSKWLPRDFRDKYGMSFIANGYDDTSFLSGMIESDLVQIGITSIPHRRAILAAIRLLPEPEMEPHVPDDIDRWLRKIGLEAYRENFRRAFIMSRDNLEVLKAMSREDIQRELGITKPGHLRRLQSAIQKLRYATTNEQERIEVRSVIEAVRSHPLEDINRREFDFWTKLVASRLRPDRVAFAHDLDLKDKLTELRNSVLMGFAIANALWIIVIMTLATKSDLNVFGTNALGLVVLVIFGAIMVIQFLCMLVHRLSTWMHMIARSPSKCGAPVNASWSFSEISTDAERRTWAGVEESDDVDAARMRQWSNLQIRNRFKSWVQRRRNQTVRGSEMESSFRVTLSDDEGTMPGRSRERQQLLTNGSQTPNYSATTER